jgi:hypothetical protein
MKMMSWSRYHCLSKPLLHAGLRYRAAKRFRTRKRARGHQAADSAPTSYFQFVIRLFRT